ncbi:hypothetical protein DL89DRAFT_268069 [Linderina pennispora]|uniref:G-patch domain-containing protein n=1 Tax=Linderina pennispora TaxID=61395 RepID=A0A1Y1W6M9_9FUNG|nr:uncharacterized protein DL89DRAFT_268069 [Linderina pennispora]ORX69035.1 hypothetical protein DL89DRAFT_268069 [Linderina pennispora]
MLEKMGWSEGKGLGANEDGRKEHTAFSELLSRLNSDSATPSDAPKAEAKNARLNRLSHRTKFRNMKRMAMQDDKALYPDSERQSGESTPSLQTEIVDSGVNVADYFAQKMRSNPALAGDLWTRTERRRTSRKRGRRRAGRTRRRKREEQEGQEIQGQKAQEQV